ncbi:MAG: response regulator [Myxococcota bacterium]
MRKQELEGSHLLVVDDDAAVRGLLARTLVDWGYRVSVAEGGGEALVLASKRRFAVILTDLEMPGLNGYALARQIRARTSVSGQNATPIVALTAHADPGVHRQCRRVGISGVLRKPLEWRFASRTLAQLCEHGRRLAFEPDVAALLPGYLAARAEDLALMWTMCEAKDADGLQHLGHRLKGSGGSFGLPKLTSIGAAIERNAFCGDFLACARALAALEEHLVRARHELAA